MNPPHLTFFCELETPALQDLFRLPDVVLLGELDASLSLGILDLSPERAKVVQRLNQAGVPVIAWLLLPEEHGFRFNLDNCFHAMQCYQAFQDWTQEHHLQWAGIGLDIEPDIALMQEFMGFPASRRRLFWKLSQRAFDYRRFFRARKTYRTLVDRMHSDGYRVESYTFPIAVDERKARSTSLHRLLGTFDIPVDKEVLMLYSSFVRPYGSGLIWSYAPESQAVAVGSTGGGTTFGGGEIQSETAPLTWKELGRDLRLAWVYSTDLYIFSLEGCVQQDFLKRLSQFEWDQPILEPLETAAKVDGWRKALSSALWIFAHPLIIISALTGGLFFFFWLRRRR